MIKLQNTTAINVIAPIDPIYQPLPGIIAPQPLPGYIAPEPIIYY